MMTKQVVARLIIMICPLLSEAGITNYQTTHCMNLFAVTHSTARMSAAIQCELVFV